MAEGRVAVVGGGLAGLSAGLRLKRLGHEVDLYERSRLLGGKATSFEVDGIEVDNGQHVFLACCEHFIDFVADLGSGAGTNRESLLYLQPRFDALLISNGRNGRNKRVRLRALELPAPYHLFSALLASSQLGLAGRMQVALALLLLRTSQLPGESFSRWLTRHHQGERARQGFWVPFVVPALNAELDEVAAGDAAFVIRTAFLEDAGAARFGFSRVPLGRIASLAVPRLDDVMLRSPVIGLELENGSRPVSKAERIRLALKGGKTRWYDGVVVAAPPERLKSILSSPKQLGVYGLDQFVVAPIVDIHLWYDVPPGTVLGHSGPTFAALLDSPIQWVFEKPAPAGETYLCCSMSAARRYVGTPGDRLVEMADGELRSSLPTVRGAKLLRGAATRDRDATFVPSIGLVRPGPNTVSPRVALAGSWTDTGWPATMESAVRSGVRAAEVLHGAIAA